MLRAGRQRRPALPAAEAACAPGETAVELAAVGIVWRGEWSVEATYAINDAVSHKGSSYIAIKAGKGKRPPESAFWNVLAQRGADGSKGPKGADGPAGPQGSVGPAGPEGPKGDAGRRGPAGPEGPEGRQGPAGPAAAVLIGQLEIRDSLETDGWVISSDQITASKNLVCHVSSQTQISDSSPPPTGELNVYVRNAINLDGTNVEDFYLGHSVMATGEEYLSSIPRTSVFPVTAGQTIAFGVHLENAEGAFGDGGSADVNLTYVCF